MSDMSLILTALGSIALLLFLVMKVRLHAVVSLILVSIIAGLFSGMNPADITNTIQQGMGEHWALLRLWSLWEPCLAG